MAGPVGVEVRAATATDLEALALVHSRSMSSAYAGILPADYLESGLYQERLAVWDRLLGKPGHEITLVAEVGGRVVGLGHAKLDASDRWGSLIENLHVDPDQTSQGIGGRLMLDLSSACIAAASRPGIHLWVYEANAGARRFYERIGGRVSDTKIADDGGGSTPSVMYSWANLSEMRVLG